MHPTLPEQMVLLSRLLAAVHGTFTHKSSNNSDIDLIVADRAADRCCMLLLGFALLLLLGWQLAFFASSTGAGCHFQQQKLIIRSIRYCTSFDGRSREADRPVRLCSGGVLLKLGENEY